MSRAFAAGGVAGASSRSFIAPHNPGQSCAPAPRRDVGDALRRARATDPATSHQAAQGAAAFAGSHCDRIVAAVQQLGEATAAEIGAACGLTVVQVDRRRKELVTAGRLRLVLGADGEPLQRDGMNVLAKAGS